MTSNHHAYSFSIQFLSERDAGLLEKLHRYFQNFGSQNLNLEAMMTNDWFFIIILLFIILSFNEYLT